MFSFFLILLSYVTSMIKLFVPYVLNMTEIRSMYQCIMMLSFISQILFF